MPKYHEFIENRLKVDISDSSKVHSYVINLLLVNETFDNVIVFFRNDADFKYFSQLVMNYYDSKMMNHTTSYNFEVAWNEKDKSFTFDNDLEDSLTFLKGLGSISSDLHKEITYRLKLYNKSASLTENNRNLTI